MKRRLLELKKLFQNHGIQWKRWRGLVTVMAMVVVFVTTYALILPAITLEKDQGKPEQGVYLDPMERGSTAALNNEERPGQTEESTSLESGNQADQAEDTDEKAFSRENQDEGSNTEGKNADDGSDQSQNTAYAHGVYTGNGDGFTVSLDLKEEMRLPADVTVSVEEIREKEISVDTAAGYQSCLSAAEKAAVEEGRGKVTAARFFKFALLSGDKEVRTDQDIDILIRPLEKDLVRKGEQAHVLAFRGPAAFMVEDVKTQMIGYRVSAYRFFYPSIAGNGSWGLLGLAVTEPKAEDEVSETASTETGASTESEAATETNASTEETAASTEPAATTETAASTEETAASTEETAASEAATETETAEDGLKPAGTLEYSGEDYKVVMTYDEKADIPEGAVLQVKEILQDSEDYERYLKEAAETLEMDKKANPRARFFDIKIMEGEKEIGPASPVSVQISYDQSMKVNEGDKVDALHFGEKKTEVIENVDVKTNRRDDIEGVTFEADSFSVYGIVTYTVDFHWEVNGKKYEFSIPGGGFVSLEHMVEVLGIASSDANAENGTDDVEKGTENEDDFAGEVPGVDESGENGTAYEEAIQLNKVDVSEAAKKFVADVERVEFSSPELVWVGKVDTDSTVGGLKEANGLEVKYSADLTEEQIKEINAQTVDAGDWAMISAQPFTSEEMLTVTMKDGEQFVVKVTDERIDSTSQLVSGQSYVLYVNANGQYYALRSDGSSQYVRNNDLEALDRQFEWNYNSFTDGGGNLVSTWSSWGGTHLSLTSQERNVVANQYGTWIYINPYNDNNRGFDFVSYDNGGNSSHHLGWDMTGFKSTSNGGIRIYVYKKQPPQFHYEVSVNSTTLGTVSGDGQQNVISFSGLSSTNKTNPSDIVATPIGDAEFVHWMLNGEILQDYGSTIRAGTLTYPKDYSDLVAVFQKDYTSVATQRINEWVDSLLGDTLTADKTAHVYDYDNRIYQIDFTASSGRYTVNPDAKIELITDTSRSMYFPENLLNPQYYYIDGQMNLGEWLLRYGDPEETYFTIGDQNGTATMYAVYHTGNQYYSQWNMVDASFYEAPDGKTRAATRVAYQNANQRTVDITTHFASNRPLTGILYTSTEKVEGKDWSRLDYLISAVKAVARAIYQLDPGAEIGLVTFNSAAAGGVQYGKDQMDNLIAALDATKTNVDGGTNPTSAMNRIWNNGYFNYPPSKKQVAILITDGAPQGTTWDDIIEKANRMKGSYHQDTDSYDVDLYTLGLALENVGTNKDQLFGIATGYHGNAENDEQLVTEVEKLLTTLLDKASFIGTITDTIDPAFYPVDAFGSPIAAGYYNDAGTRIDTAPTDQTTPYSEWIQNNDNTWTVVWHNQEIKWPEEGGWKRSIHVKAKEDFMGGNHINTNVGDSNKAETSAIKHEGSPTGVYPMDSTYTRKLETPYVNVDELTLTEHSTYWRVYLGTDVDPEAEIRSLWNKIEVNQVVKENGISNDTITEITAANQMFYGLNTSGSDTAAPNGTDNEKLKLSDYVDASALNSVLAQIKDSQTSSTGIAPSMYSAYGHSSLGNFVVKLEKTVNTEAAEDNTPEPHTTKKKGENREVYTLTVTYQPATNEADEAYEHTTSGHSAGKIADGYDGTTGNKIESENIHKIHVFAKDLEIQKKDMTNTSRLIDTAKFKLYRTAKKVINPETGLETSEYESGAEDLKVGEVTKKVVQVGEEMTTSGGKITVEDLSYAPDGTYYLVETKAPDGYIMATEPIEMHLYLDDEYTHYLAPHGSITKAETDDNPYNWTQTVNRFVYDSSKTGVMDDTKITIEVLNNPGVELPATGGPGTWFYTILGSILIIGAGILLWRRHRTI